ncbi:hypothetical protein, partial [Lysobacter sp. A3-1-A15]
MALLSTLRLIAALAAAIVVLIFGFIVLESLPALGSVGMMRFFNDPSWHPAGGAARGSFNLGPMLVGTIAAAGGAILLATPLGLGSALFSRFYAPAPVGRWYRRLVE